MLVNELFILNYFMKIYKIISLNIFIMLLVMVLKKKFFNFFIILLLKTINNPLSSEFFYFHGIFFFIVMFNQIKIFKQKKVCLKNITSVKYFFFYKKMFMLRKKLRSRTVFLKKKLLYKLFYLKKKRILFAKIFKIRVFFNKIYKKKKLKISLILKKIFLVQYINTFKIYHNIKCKIQKNYLDLFKYCICIFSKYKKSLIIIIRILLYLSEYISDKMYFQAIFSLLKIENFNRYLQSLKRR
ncbi:hypothetical protein M951_chr165 (nucleomorph) [Lotharella oceanica]|uniref:Uncharacterized protein n=2 Tax=Lotharella oceanica TaxID=641309 RepID=A0A060D6C6_9EUKA|nr:hypothetical protein M951_chr165 [Lotharella oceanica]